MRVPEVYYKFLNMEYGVHKHLSFIYQETQKEYAYNIASIFAWNVLSLVIRVLIFFFILLVVYKFYRSYTGLHKISSTSRLLIEISEGKFSTMLFI